MQIYLVGGAIRDELLGLPVVERDWVVVGATPKQMLALGYQPVGKDFPVFLHPETHEEYALARSERKTKPGYSGFVFNTDTNITLEQDLLRRDLTINAIARDVDGKIIDPYQGVRDIQKRILRHVSEAFVEDPVRVLRVARFAAKLANFGFTVASETNVFMQRMVTNGEVSHLVAERVWQELVKTLKTAIPSTFFQVLSACRARDIIFPELQALTLEQIKIIDVELTEDNLPIRFALLTAKVSEKNLKKLLQRLRVPKNYKELALLVHRHYKKISLETDIQAKDLITLIMQCDGIRRPQRFSDFLKAAHILLHSQGLDEKSKINLILQVTEAMIAIDTRGLQQQGLKGVEFAHELQNLRIALVNKIMNSSDQL